MKPYLKIFFTVIALLCLTNCGDNNENISAIDETQNNEILSGFSTNVAQASYNDLKIKAFGLNDAIFAFAADKSTVNLEACRTQWKASRQAWEQTESFLFGPVSTEAIDPRIDTWPVNFTDLEGQLSSENEFNESYINNLGEALKGFHPIEYLIFGLDGNKTPEDFTAREIEYLLGLGLNLKKLATEVAEGWDPSVPTNYHVTFSTAGKGSVEYPTQLDAFVQLVSAMAGICDEVANAKIGEVYFADNPKELEESPYSKNSITDFINNIKGVQNVYLGKYTTDGKGIDELVKKHNLALDGRIKANINSAIAALENITDSFGDAVDTQPIQVQNAINAINALKDVIDDGDASNKDLMYFIQVHTK